MIWGKCGYLGWVNSTGVWAAYLSFRNFLFQAKKASKHMARHLEGFEEPKFTCSHLCVSRGHGVNANGVWKDWQYKYIYKWIDKSVLVIKSKIVTFNKTVYTSLNVMLMNLNKWMCMCLRLFFTCLS